jgi:Outer membrane lipoprotein carrier protein LolA-like
LSGRAFLGLALLSCSAALCAPAPQAGAPQPGAPQSDAPQSDAPQPGAPAQLDQLMQLLAARRHGHVAFSEVQTLAMLDRPLESSGELLYDAPDHLEKRTLRPKPEDVILEHGVLTDQRGRRTRTVDLAAYPQLSPLIESLRATLSGDRASLEREFEVRFAGDLADWTLELTPRAAATARIVHEVRMAGSRATLKSVEILQADGDRTLLTLGPELAP